MSESKPPSTPSERSQAETHKTSGRIAFDKRGNPIWEWALKTGIFGSDIDTQRLRALEAKDLKIVEEPVKGQPVASQSADRFSKQPKTDKPAVKPVKDSGGGMNPYDSTTLEPQKTLAQSTRPPKSMEPSPLKARRSWWESFKRIFSGEEG